VPIFSELLSAVPMEMLLCWRKGDGSSFVSYVTMRVYTSGLPGEQQIERLPPDRRRSHTHTTPNCTDVVHASVNVVAYFEVYFLEVYFYSFTKRLSASKSYGDIFLKT
jgi:hypothetical protein